MKLESGREGEERGEQGEKRDLFTHNFMRETSSPGEGKKTGVWTGNGGGGIQGKGLGGEGGKDDFSFFGGN